MSYLIRLEIESGKYCVTHMKFPGVEASGGPFYGAIEALDRAVTEKKTVSAQKKIETRLLTNEIIIQTRV